jgi:hypothetical protein
MYNSPADALTAFIDQMENWESPAQPLYKGNREKALEAGLEFLRPFLLNPEQHKEQVKLMLEGLAVTYMSAQLGPLLKIAFHPATNWISRNGTEFKKSNQIFVERVRSARADLLRSLKPGELTVAILPARAKASTDTAIKAKLFVFQVNVALYPDPAFTPQSMSVQLSVDDADVKFADVEPSSRVESIGSYEVGIQESGKFTRTVKDPSKIASTVDAKVAKVEVDEITEDSASKESATQTSIKELGQMLASLVISSAVGGVARWQLLRAPNQLLTGGSSFFATAFVPPALREVTLKARVCTELEGYGTYEAESEQRVGLSEASGLLTI